MKQQNTFTDDDVRKLLPMETAVAKMEDAFLELAHGTLEAPPRFRVDIPEGGLVFTAGSAYGSENVIGFRVYPAFSGSKQSLHEQIVAVYDAKDGHFKGVVFGRLLGATRTGAIGGVAIKYLSKLESKTLAVIGAGYQARSQVLAAMAVRPFDEIRFFSRTLSRAETFAQEVKTHFMDKRPLKVFTTSSARAAVAGADVVICATNSRQPVLKSEWLVPGTYVATIGPQFIDAHEMPLDIADLCQVIVTDSPAQISAYGRRFFLGDITGNLVRLTPLDQIVAGKAPGRTSADDICLFCSVGLAGTEVVLANELLKRAGVTDD